MGCSTFGTTPKGTSIYVSAKEPGRIRFEGKGAGAGIMLMSAMGPAGIAIGIAIDEGIAKDIQKTAEEGKVNFQEIFIQALQSSTKMQGTYLVGTSEGADVNIRIDRVGFKLIPGENRVVSNVVANVSFKDGRSDQTITSQNDVNGAGDLFVGIKTQPELIAQVWEAGVGELLEGLASKLQ